MPELICEAGLDLELWRCTLEDLREQDRNPRVMPPEMYKRLSSNIAREGRMESIPFTVLRETDGRIWFELISGHHRTRAARTAGLTDLIVLADVRDLDRSQIVAKQLAHNTIDGVDDQEMVADLWKELDRVDDMLEAYVDPALFENAEPVDMGALSKIELSFDWRLVSLTFLPKQLTDLQEVFDALEKGQDLIGVAPMEYFDDFAETAREIGLSYDIRSVGAIVSKMVQITKEHLSQLPDDDATG